MGSPRRLVAGGAPTAVARAVGAGRAAGGAPREAPWLAPLLFLFVAKGILLVAMVGPFTGHDEVDHFWYVARLAEGNGLGVVGEVDLPPAAAEYAAYVADYPTNAEVIQPPLYHALLVPLYLLGPDRPEARLALLRLASIPLGAAVVWLAFRTARLLFPGDALLTAGVPVFVAFHPQFGFEAAIVNHDILLIAIVTGVLFLTLREMHDGPDRRRQWAIGLLGGAGLWTKASFGLVLPVVALGVVLTRRASGGRWSELVPAGGRSLGLPLLLASPWFLRSYLLYGDPTGTGRLREIPEFGEQARSVPEMVGSGRFWRQMLEDFWGNYGWRQVPLDPAEFRAVWVLWGGAGVGLAIGAVRAWLRRRGGRGPRWTPFQRQGVALLAGAVVLFVGGVLYVGTVQFTQARFAFPAMVGFATLTVLGIGGWTPERWRFAVVPLLATVLMAFTTLVLLRLLLPFYYGPGGGAAVGP